MGSNYRICTKCIMDTTDPDISFDINGVCSHCHKYDSIVKSDFFHKKKESYALVHLAEIIRKKGKGKPYDCIVGFSGGVDSTYTAHLSRQLGLRPLAVHVDNGWDSELAASNIEKVLKKLEMDLYTCVLDWQEFRDLQLAFLKASTPDCEIPTDHAILGALYQVAARQHIHFILTGYNTSTEAGGVPAWSQGHEDWRYIKNIHSIFGTKSITSFPHYGPLQFISYTLIKRIRLIPILDYLDYDKRSAIRTLQNEYDWQYYGGKHYESIYTRFVQGYILPKKFGFDKRRLHLSSLIWSGQISREAALEQVIKPDYPEELQEQDREFVIKKLGISYKEFELIMQQPPKSFWDYPSYKRIFHRYKWIESLRHCLKPI